MPEADVFIVRVWTDAGPRPEFRAAVNHAGTDESAWFTDADALADYFARRCEAPLPSATQPETRKSREGEP